MRLKKKKSRFQPSMRNPLDKSSVAQSLDVRDRLKGSLRFPVDHE